MPSKRITSSLFSLTCGCKDSNSVSISPSTTITTTTSSSTAASTTTATSTSKPITTTSYELEIDVDDDSTSTSKPITTTSYELEIDVDDDSPSTPSFSGLLRQLTDLETTLLQIKTGESRNHREPAAHPHHRRWRSDGGDGGGGRGWVEESVAVVKESEDPLGDFRGSMLQMIVEKEIVDGEGLRELLRRFLSLNSPRYHDVILRAFAEIWSEVFEGYEDTPDLIRRSRSRSVSYRQ